ncbi:hypothetical protein ACJX0J_008295, partial [Zea mays]
MELALYTSSINHTTRFKVVPALPGNKHWALKCCHVEGYMFQMGFNKKISALFDYYFTKNLFGRELDEAWATLKLKRIDFCALKIFLPLGLYFIFSLTMFLITLDVFSLKRSTFAGIPTFPVNAS